MVPGTMAPSFRLSKEEFANNSCITLLMDCRAANMPVMLRAPVSVANGPARRDRMGWMFILSNRPEGACGVLRTDDCSRERGEKSQRPTLPARGKTVSPPKRRNHTWVSSLPGLPWSEGLQKNRLSSRKPGNRASLDAKSLYSGTAPPSPN
jgi:hypothetical protein